MNKTHKFTLITNPITPHIDKDYVPENVGEYNYLGVAPPSTSQLLGIRRTDSIYRSFGFGLRILTSWTSVGFLDVGAFFCRSAMNWY
ncbi:hypothetical protein RIR_jg30617.t1 [Rhizophagus irregularis DAOM 181602=DAOM 197198]|nr:hypothetical protein RIR_jg30617.t1 [Rhizophagus irregularis DAOM 181602=DAOM 197198]